MTKNIANTNTNTEREAQGEALKKIVDVLLTIKKDDHAVNVLKAAAALYDAYVEW